MKKKQQRKNKEIMKGIKSGENVWLFLLVAKASFCMHRPIQKFPFCPCTNQMPLAPRPCKRPPCMVYFLHKRNQGCCASRVDQTPPRHRPAQPYAMHTSLLPRVIHAPVGSSFSRKLSLNQGGERGPR